MIPNRQSHQEDLLNDFPKHLNTLMFSVHQFQVASVATDCDQAIILVALVIVLYVQAICTERTYNKKIFFLLVSSFN